MVEIRVVDPEGLIVGHRWHLAGEAVEVSAKMLGYLQEKAAGRFEAVESLTSKVEGRRSKVEDLKPSDETAGIETLGLGSRVEGALRKAGFETVEGVRLTLQLGGEALTAVPGIGTKALEEILLALDKVGAADGE